MKKVIQPNIKKVYGTATTAAQQQQQQQESQLNAVRKIHNLLTSGAVTVTGPTQQMIKNTKLPIQNASVSSQMISLNNQVSVHEIVHDMRKCYLCDDMVNTNQFSIIADTITTYSNTDVLHKIGQIMGNEYMVIVTDDEAICKKCLSMINHYDRLETDSERVKNSILNLIYKTHGLVGQDVHANTSLSPPIKMQRIGTGNAAKKIYDGETETTTTTVRKIPLPKDNDVDLTIKPVTTTNSVMTLQPIRKGPIKFYKCLSCDFKTQDLNEFQPHHEQCKQQNGFKCRVCKRIFQTNTTLKQHINEKHGNDNTCTICNDQFPNDIALKKHMETSHPDAKQIIEPALINHLYCCHICPFKSTDKKFFDDHMKKHSKAKPFKCRVCSARFEKREEATTHAKTHQPNFYKCGTCAASFTQKELLIKHFETHQPKSPQIQITAQNKNSATQKLLQATIDEALKESSENSDAKNIHFFSCNICSLTFIQESYYRQHMETHQRGDTTKKTLISGSGYSSQTSSTPQSTNQNLIRQNTRSNGNSIIINSNSGGHNTNEQQQSAGSAISDADIESIFEKMHSDKTDTDTSSTTVNAATNGNENLVITSEQNAVGGITFNITIPQQDNDDKTTKTVVHNQLTTPVTKSDNVSAGVGIDMPVLDQNEEANSSIQIQKTGDTSDSHSGGPVNMPSLDDECDSQNQSANNNQVMDLEDIQNSVESGQIKFILNENGQILQLDNHIITTDADGNQILVQGSDPEHIQQLLRTVGVLQTGDSLDGETLQMIGENNQMIIVQQGDNEAQLIDASLLNADGHIVIQHSGDDEMVGGAHAVDEDGNHIPVSVAFTTQSDSTVVMKAQHETVTEEIEQHKHDEIDEQLKNDRENKDDNLQHENIITNDTGTVVVVSSSSMEQTETSNTQSITTSNSGGGNSETFFGLEDLMQQTETKVNE